MKKSDLQKPLVLVGLTGGLLFAFQNCGKASMEVNTPTADSSVVNTSTPNPPVVCDPLGGGATATAKNGLIGNLKYVPVDQQTRVFINLEDVLANAVDSSLQIFMSQVNVPTRVWTEGFSTDGANALVDDSGVKILEYFALHLDTVVKLTPNDAPGYYQFATLSDDGALLYSQESNGTKTVYAGVSDTLHGPRLDCGAITASFNANSSLPLTLDYYQGPRDQIAMVLLWRHVADANVPADCDLATGDWSTIPAANFYLPPTNAANPCAQSK